MITFETTAEFEAAVMEVVKKRLSVATYHYGDNGVEVSLIDNDDGIFAECGIENIV